MTIIDGIKNGFKKHFDKKKEEREMLEKLQLEAEMQRRTMFQQEFKENALEVARAKAKQDAAKLSGLQKLRATNRARRLTQDGQNPGSSFSKLSEYTQKNLARTEENKKRTQEMRETAKKMREDRLAEQQKLRAGRTTNGVSKPFGNSSFGRR